jgi:putative nucleotidyltransferase with HDIG domain
MKRLKKKSEGESLDRSVVPWGARLTEWLWLGLFVLGIAVLTSLQFSPPPQFHLSLLPFNKITAELMVLGVLITTIYYYSRIRVPAIWQRPRWTLFAISIVLVVTLFDKIITLFSVIYQIPNLAYAVPSAFGAAMMGLFFGAGAGFMTNTVVSIIVSLGSPSAFVDFLMAFGGGLIALFSVLRLTKISDLAVGGIGIALINLALYSAGMTLQAIAIDPRALFWAATGGLATALLTMAAIPVAEWATQRTSPLGLVQLLNPAHPLLTLLREKAPGTYHHSCTVADLGESAAEAIGADTLLTKVGGYYHDIGKMERPEFFMENQRDGINPHDELTPNMSRVILLSHIKRGLEMGRQYGLNEDVLQFILEHHGTSVIRYFYVKALQAGNKDCSVSMDDYRYDATPPQTKETAIIMLADGVEAASRAAENGARLDVLVEEAIRDKLNDGQLNKAPVTLADIEKVKTAFCETLHAMKHTRAEAYPKLERKTSWWTRAV